MVIKMNETKIKYGILCSAVILAVIIGQSATAGVMNLEAKDNDLLNPPISTTATVNLGSVLCTQYNGDVEADVTIDAAEKYVTLSSSGENVKFTVEYQFILDGTADFAKVQLWYWDKDGKMVWDRAESGESTSGPCTLKVERSCIPDQNFKIYIKAWVHDWYGFGDTDDDEGTVLIKPTKYLKPQISGYGKITGMNLRPMTPTKVEADVTLTNSGDDGSRLHWAWGYCEDRLYGDYDIFPGSGWLDYGEEQAVAVEVTLPEGAKRYKETVRFYNVDDETNYVDIPVSIGYKAKPAAYSMQSLFEKTLGGYPYLLTLLSGFLNL